MMNALQIYQNVEEESALKVCAEDGEEDNSIFTKDNRIRHENLTFIFSFNYV